MKVQQVKAQPYPGTDHDEVYPPARRLYNQIKAPTKRNPNKSQERLHRFAGVTSSKEVFYIQIKENRRTKRKDLLSIFPAG